MTTLTSYRRATLACLGLALLVGVSACDLYFPPSQDHYQYCDSTGCYDCVGDSCSPVGGNGYYCASNADCATGCYCDTNPADYSYGTCVETGFCTDSSQCPTGSHCDGRQSCVPDNQQTACYADTDCAAGSYCDEATGACLPSTTCTAAGQCPTGSTCDSRGTCVPVECTDNTQCGVGCYCDTTNGTCVETGYCTTDADCATGSYCDEPRQTCTPGTDPDKGSCAGAVTCSTAIPTCPADSVPLIKNGCYTGECQAIASCDLPPVCDVINTESSCLARNDCDAVYNGLNCKKPDGTACQSGDTNCTCERFVFADCRTGT
ncbi:MAG: hypothetical protein K8W52_46525 [Deltaproteobacteria bacterium]|nr:hypothetical protein [Deltaproteobacteria bacterium]